MSEADFELNEKLKKEEKLEGSGSESGDEGEEELGGGEEESDNEEKPEGGEEDNSGEIDSEMMGDVQPESSETTQA